MPGDRVYESRIPQPQRTGQRSERAPEDPGDGRGRLPSLTLPKGGGALRPLGEKFAADPFTGAGSFELPLPLSPGRAGLTPPITLRYHSAAGNGPCGLGWRLSFPSVRRSTQKRIPRYQDGPDGDTFLLEGSDELVPAFLPHAGGWREDRYDSGPHTVRRYRPRVESDFARIERWTHRQTGETHWITVSPDNVTSAYGRTPATRIADPADPRRVFEWLIEEARDDRGNVVRFEYKPEDAVGVAAGLSHERNRLGPQAQRYLKRVHYANLVPGRAEGWLFTAVFDYGDHDEAIPRIAEDRAWPARADAFSTSRAGFDVRTRRLCRRVLMFHRFAELGAAPCLVRSLDLGYREDPAAAKLVSATQRGYIRAAGAHEYQAGSYPALQFDYTEARIADEIQTVDTTSAENVQGQLVAASTQWADLDAEGLPGLLAETAGAWFYKRNLGGGRLGTLEQVALKPTRIDLATGRLADLARDGRQYLVRFEPPAAGYHRREGEAWGSFTALSSCANVDWQDPNLRFVDLDGDGTADLLITEDHALRWHPSRGREGFGPGRRVARAVDEEQGPALVLADPEQSIYLADMDGDGLADLVRLRNGEICYWSNLGDGRFGPKVSMDGAPVFDAVDQFRQERIRLADIDGTGTTDVVYLGRGEIQCWSNQAGNRWALVRRIAHVPETDALGRVQVLDLLGAGTACVVWSSPHERDGGRPLRYLDLCGGGKPHLLTSIANNLGGEVRVSYAPSTRFFLEDRAQGRPWATSLAFPVQVVDRIETFDAVTRARFVTRYRYRHGHYDEREHEFRGFGVVEQWDSESYEALQAPGLFPPGANLPPPDRHVPPAHTRTWLHTGAPRWAEAVSRGFAQEYYAGDPEAFVLPDTVLPPGLSIDEEADACRALKGRVLRREVYADDGSPARAHPYTVSERSYTVRPLQPAIGGGPAVFLVHDREGLAYHYERDPADPRIQHTMTLVVDDFGGVARAVSIAYPRRRPAFPEQATAWVTCTENDLIHAATHPGWYRIGLSAERRTWHVTGLPAPAAGPYRFAAVEAQVAAAREIAYEDTPDGGQVEKRLTARARTVYARDDLTGPLALGRVESMALPWEQYAMVFTPALAQQAFRGRAGAPTNQMLSGEAGYRLWDGAWWQPTGHPVHDPAAFYAVASIVDPFGRRTSVVYDAYGLLPVESEDPLQNVIRAQNHYRVLHPYLITDANGNRSAVRFDALGMVTATIVMGKPGDGDGDVLDEASVDASPQDDPTTTMDYDLTRWVAARTPVFIHTRARERHAAVNSRRQESYRYFDGSGNEVLAKARAEAGLAPERDETGALRHDANGALVLSDTSPELRWVGTGRTVYDNKGNPVRTYEPFFSRTHRYEDEAELVEYGVASVHAYDPLGRCIRIDRPDGAYSATDFDAWRQAIWDENDTVADSRWLLERQLLDPADPANAPEIRAMRLAAAHAGTPAVAHLDALGRIFLDVQDNGPAGRLETRRALDADGRILSVTDPRGNVAVTNRWDMLGRNLVAESPDCGPRWVLVNAASNPIRRWDGRGRVSRWVYDQLQRQTHRYVADASGAERLRERHVYGEIHSGARALNLRGHLMQHYDGSGLLVHVEYDFKGNLLESRRRLAADYRQGTDWSPLDAVTSVQELAQAAAPLLEAGTFRTFSEYDALNRATRVTGPDGSELRKGYNAGGLLEDVGVRWRGGATTTYVSDIDYDARGQVERVEYGNGATASYAYDPFTFRLVRITTRRAAGPQVVQDLLYTYDPVGHVVEARDEAQQTVFFDNAAVAAGARYEYDAAYRLVRAEGREHAGQAANAPRDASEFPLGPVPHPNDLLALRPYTEQYEYDEAGNLLLLTHFAPHEIWARGAAYEGGGNRLSAISVPGDDPHGPPQGFHGVCVHDDNGNLTALPSVAAVHWDDEDQVRQIDLPAGARAFYVYGPGGGRVRKVVELPGGRRDERIYLGGFELFRRHAGAQLVLQRDTLHVSAEKRRLGLIEALVREDGVDIDRPEPIVRYQLGDLTGSARVELDERARVITYEEYYPYGATSYRALRAGLEVSPKRYRYAGRERDEESGLDYGGARYYVPWLGRWLSCDPIGSKDHLNLYLYALDDPVNVGDPSGAQVNLGALNASRASESGFQIERFLKDVTIEYVGRGTRSQILQIVTEFTPIENLPGGLTAEGHGIFPSGFTQEGRFVGAAAHELRAIYASGDVAGRGVSSLARAEAFKIFEARTGQLPTGFDLENVFEVNTVRDVQARRPFEQTLIGRQLRHAARAVGLDIELPVRINIASNVHIEVHGEFRPLAGTARAIEGARSLGRFTLSGLGWVAAGIGVGASLIRGGIGVQNLLEGKTAEGTVDVTEGGIGLFLSVGVPAIAKKGGAAVIGGSGAALAGATALAGFAVGWAAEDIRRALRGEELMQDVAIAYWGKQISTLTQAIIARERQRLRAGDVLVPGPKW